MRNGSARLVLRLLAGCLLAPAGAAAQEPLALADEYHVRVFTVADGIPVSNAQAIAQPGDGYLYVGGGHGLSRFDGHAFTPIRIDRFGTRRISRLLTDRDGHLWVLSREGDVGYVEDGRVRGLPWLNQPILDVTRTKAGGVWLAGPAGLVRVDPRDDAPFTRFGKEDGLPSDTVTAVIERPGRDPIAVTPHGLVRIRDATGDDDALSFEPLGPPFHLDRIIPAVFEGRYGIWIRTARGALHYDGERVTAYRLDDDEPVPIDLIVPPGSGVRVWGWLFRLTDVAARLPDRERLTNLRALVARDGTAVRRPRYDRRHTGCCPWRDHAIAAGHP